MSYFDKLTECRHPRKLRITATDLRCRGAQTVHQLAAPAQMHRQSNDLPMLAPMTCAETTAWLRGSHGYALQTAATPAIS